MDVLQYPWVGLSYQGCETCPSEGTWCQGIFVRVQGSRVQGLGFRVQGSEFSGV